MTNTIVHIAHKKTMKTVGSSTFPESECNLRRDTICSWQYTCVWAVKFPFQTVSFLWEKNSPQDSVMAGSALWLKGMEVVNAGHDWTASTMQNIMYSFWSYHVLKCTSRAQPPNFQKCVVGVTICTMPLGCYPHILTISITSVCSCRFRVLPQQTEEHGDTASIRSGCQWVHSEAASAPYAPAGETGPGSLQRHNRLIYRSAGSSRDSQPQQSHRTHTGRWVFEHRAFHL